MALYYTLTTKTLITQYNQLLKIQHSHLAFLVMVRIHRESTTLYSKILTFYPQMFLKSDHNSFISPVPPWRDAHYRRLA